MSSQRLTLIILSRHSPLYFLMQGLLLNVELANSVSMASQEVPEILSLHWECWGYRWCQEKLLSEPWSSCLCREPFTNCPISPAPNSFKVELSTPFEQEEGMPIARISYLGTQGNTQCYRCLSAISSIFGEVRLCCRHFRDGKQSTEKLNGFLRATEQGLELLSHPGTLTLERACPLCRVSCPCPLAT